MAVAADVVSLRLANTIQIGNDLEEAPGGVGEELLQVTAVPFHTDVGGMLYDPESSPFHSKGCTRCQRSSAMASAGLDRIQHQDAVGLLAGQLQESAAYPPMKRGVLLLEPSLACVLHAAGLFSSNGL